MARITNDLSFNAPRRSSADGRNPGANCTNCNALYHLIKAEGGPETVDRNLNCQSCGARFLLAIAGLVGVVQSNQSVEALIANL